MQGGLVLSGAGIEHDKYKQNLKKNTGVWQEQKNHKWIVLKILPTRISKIKMQS